MLTLSILLTLSVASQAAPAANIIGGSSFSASAVYQDKHVRNGTAALLEAYAKYGLTPSEPVAAAFLNDLAKRQDSSATAFQADGKSKHLVPTSIGGQTLNLNFDTGSSDLWVFSTELATTSKKGHNIYSPSKSSTYKSLSGYTWSLEYVDGTGASGDVGTDTVKVGGTSVTGQAIEKANTVSSRLAGSAADGVLGLGFSSINQVKPQKQLTFFDNAKPFLDSPLFTAYLPANGNGSYDFGFIDATKYTGSIQYASVDTSNGFWEVDSTSYKVGSTVYSLDGYTAIVDTGTAVIIMTKSVVDTYYSRVSGASYDSSFAGYTFPCSATLPNLSVRIGSTNYATIPGTLLNYASTGGGKCFGGLQSAAGSGSINIYGDPFLNANYGVFDANGPQFGFAPISN